MSSNSVHEAVRGNVDQIHAQGLERKGLPSASVGTTITTEIPDGDQMHPNLPWDDTMLFSNMVPVFAISSGNVQKPACAGSDSSILVSSTAFPLMGGCFFSGRGGRIVGVHKGRGIDIYRRFDDDHTG